ncbi:MAG: hypothetical protein ABEL76_11180 [Bradymonadaceae bacterium]
MKVVNSWEVDSKEIELLHESGQPSDEGRWEYRVNGELKMYGRDTPRGAREAVSTRRKLRY